MSTPSSAGATANPVSAMNIHSVSTFIPTFDGSFPVQDFIQEVREAAKLGTWTDNITLKVAKSKLHGPVADMVRNREDLNHAPTFEDFSTKLISALHTEKPVSVRLQDLMTCVQLPSESVDAYATRIRQKSKSLTEWDATEETKNLKNRTVAATFIKGLNPSIRQLVIPANISDFETAISLARSHEINQSLMPTETPIQTLPTASTSAVPPPTDAAMLDIQTRVASLELSAAQNSARGRGNSHTRGRGRGRQPCRQNFHGPSQFRQNHSWTGPPRSYSHQYSRPRSFHTGNRSNSSSNVPGCSHCDCHNDDRRYRPSSRSMEDEHRRPSRSPNYRYRSTSRSPNRQQHRRRHFSRSPSASPSRSRYQSPNGYRSRH